MQIKIGYDLQFDVRQLTPMVLMLFVHPDRRRDLMAPDTLHVEPFVPIKLYTDAFGNIVGRINAPPGYLRLHSQTVIYDDVMHDQHDESAPEVPVHQLPDEVLQFLIASRYCEVDQLVQTAWNLFGQSPPGWHRVKAICNWVHTNVRFDYACARPTKTAWDTYTEGTGVCRDFTHLALTFCRCMNIPARYATGYLGDINVPIVPGAPMDFSACFEAYLGGKWYVFDARFNTHRLGRILMARGRDAADVALTTSFGQADLSKFFVICDEIVT